MIATDSPSTTNKIVQKVNQLYVLSIEKGRRDKIQGHLYLLAPNQTPAQCNAFFPKQPGRVSQSDMTIIRPAPEHPPQDSTSRRAVVRGIFPARHPSWSSQP